MESIAVHVFLCLRLREDALSSQNGNEYKFPWEIPPSILSDLFELNLPVIFVFVTAIQAIFQMCYFAFVLWQCNVVHQKLWVPKSSGTSFKVSGLPAGLPGRVSCEKGFWSIRNGHQNPRSQFHVNTSALATASALHLLYFGQSVLGVSFIFVLCLERNHNFSFWGNTFKMPGFRPAFFWRKMPLFRCGHLWFPPDTRFKVSATDFCASSGENDPVPLAQRKSEWSLLLTSCLCFDILVLDVCWQSKNHWWQWILVQLLPRSTNNRKLLMSWWNTGPYWTHTKQIKACNFCLQSLLRQCTPNVYSYMNVHKILNCTTFFCNK